MRPRGHDRSRLRLGLLLAALAGALAACSAKPAPVGRWEGVYETPDAMVIARLETFKDGSVRISAPDALDLGNVAAEDRQAIRDRLAEGLASGWDDVETRKMAFDGKIFRKPGGVAPQIEWRAKDRSMILYVYFGTQAAIHITLHPVKDFSTDPWDS